MTEATWALVAGTFVLAVAAAWYAFETRRIVDRMDKEHEERNRPLLAFHLVPWHAQTVKLRIVNVGPGTAHAIKGDVEASDKTAFPWSYPVLLPGKYEEFGFPAEAGATAEKRFNMDAIRQRVETVHAQFRYKSASGRQYVLDEVIAVKDITDDWIESRMMATQDHPERLLPRVAKALDDIARALQNQ